MTEMFGEAWSPMSVPDLAPDDDDESAFILCISSLIDIAFDCFVLYTSRHIYYPLSTMLFTGNSSY